MNLRAAANVADLAFNDEVRIHSFQSLDRFLRATHVFLQRTLRQIEYDGVESSPRRLEGLWQRVSMIGVEVDRERTFVTQRADERCELGGADKFALTLGRPDDDGDIELLRASQDTFEQHQVAHIEMCNGATGGSRFREHLVQRPPR